jgi:hypothetical protein
MKIGLHECKWSIMGHDILLIVVSRKPLDFWNFLRHRCEDMGVRILLEAEIKAANIEDGALKSVDIEHESGDLYLDRCKIGHLGSAITHR